MTKNNYINCRERIKENVMTAVIQQVKKLQQRISGLTVGFDGIRTHGLCDSGTNGIILIRPLFKNHFYSPYLQLRFPILFTVNINLATFNNVYYTAKLQSRTVII